MEEQAKNLRDHLPSRPSAAAAAPHERLTELWRFVWSLHIRYAR